MTSESIAGSAPDLIVRESSPDELPRALYLFQHHGPPNDARLFVAIRTRPVPRLAAAGAIWLQGKTAFFRTVCQPGISRSTIANPLIAQLENWAQNNGADTIRFADLLTDDDEWGSVLRNREYYAIRSERFFQVAFDSAHRRVTILTKKCQADIPKAWRTEAIRKFQPEILINLITGHRLLPVTELRQYWRADTPLVSIWIYRMFYSTTGNPQEPYWCGVAQTHCSWMFALFSVKTLICARWAISVCFATSPKGLLQAVRYNGWSFVAAKPSIWKRPTWQSAWAAVRCLNGEFWGKKL
jgi:hypothetical protein